ncbi:MAG: hypothetical protein QXF11_03960, partial [Candidatus Hadarchaeales archaeon]
RPLVQRKKDKRFRGWSSPLESKIQGVCGKLNDLATRYLNKINVSTDIGQLIEGKVDKLTLVPPVTWVEVGEERNISIYCPKNMVGESKCKLQTDSDCIELSTKEITLQPSEKYPDLCYNYFTVTGVNLGMATVFCSLGDKDSSNCVINVVREKEIGKKKRRDKVAGRKGLFKSIKFDDLENPTQRVAYLDGVIFIYTNFPSTMPYISARGRLSNNPAAKAILAELIGDAFCRVLARKALEAGKQLGDPIDSYMAHYNEIQKLFLEKIHREIDKIVSEYQSDFQ